MTITFEDEKDVIVYALEKIICYARDNCYIFVAQSVWWIASVIGLSEGLATHIDNLRIRFEASHLVADEDRERLVTHIDKPRVRSEASQLNTDKDQLSAKETLLNILQEPSSVGTQESYIHPDRIHRNNKDSASPEADKIQAKINRATSVVQSAKKFIAQSRKERKALKQKPCGLSRTRSGQIPEKPLTKKQRNRLEAIPIDTISKYLDTRKKN